VNYRHLYYFWTVAKEGSLTRAAERLGLAIQTVSAQINLLEQEVGKALLMPHGRRLVPTDAGRTALAYADQIFLLGQEMRDALDQSGSGRMRLNVGISDSLPKLSAFRLLEPTSRMDTPVRLTCHEGDFDDLLGELALHKLDVVLTDRPVRSDTNLRLFSHLLADSPSVLVGAPALAKRHARDFPAGLSGAPFLLPSRNNSLRARIDTWFEQHAIRPDIVGEFDDNALLNTFGRNGAGLFFAPAILEEDVREQFGARVVGEVEEVRAQIYLVSKERKINHPAVEAIVAAIA
jgi:LysR family transcriptional regulator, transcriptional activator of nhaA